MTTDRPTVQSRRVNPRRRSFLPALGLLLAGAGCGILGNGTRNFTVKVDSILVAASVAAEEHLAVRFVGMVGPNGCYRLADAVTGRSPDLLQIEFQGEYRDALCTQEPVYLDYQVNLAPPFSDPFTIRALQPSGPPLEKSVRVQSP